MESPHNMRSNQHVGVDGAVALRGDSRELCYRPLGSTMAGCELLSSVITMVQVRSHGMADIANGGHITVRIAVGVGQ